MKVGEFFVDLGINATGGATLRDFASGLLGMKMSTLSVIGALGAVGNYFVGAAGAAANSSIAFQRFANQTGISAQKLQELQIVGKQANVSVDDVASGVFNLQMSLAALARGEGNIAPFNKLLVDSYADLDTVLLQLRQRAKTTEPIQFTSQIMEMGLPASFVNVLRLSDKEYSDFRKTAHGMSAQMQSDNLKSVESMVQLGLKIKDINIQSGHVALGVGAAAAKFAAGGIDKGGYKGAADVIGAPAIAFNALANGLIGAVDKKVTNYFTTTVNGDTHDKSFAEDVTDGITEYMDQVSGQTPVGESK